VNRYPTPDEVVAAVCEAAGITPSELFSQSVTGYGLSRNADLLDARAASAALLRDRCRQSYPELARTLRMRSHHTARNIAARTSPRIDEITGKARASLDELTRLAPKGGGE